MDRRLLVKVSDVDGNIVITKFVRPEVLNLFILSIPNIYDAGYIEIQNFWYGVDELKDLIRH